MTPLEQFYHQTVDLIRVLENEEKADRDEKLATIDKLLTAREEVMAGITAPFSTEDKALGTKTMELNEKLASLLMKEKLFIEKDIKGVQHKKEATPKYTNPYESMSGLDGVYYDKRN